MDRWLSRLVAIGVFFALLACLDFLPSMPQAFADELPPDAQLFPLGKTTIVRGMGKTFYIDGPSVIPKSAEITVQRGVKIVGVNGASLDVQGGLKVHGTQDTWVTIYAVDFSPTTQPFRGLHLDMVDFNGCTFKHGDGQSFGGEITIENSTLQKDCVFDVCLNDGFLRLMTVKFGIPCTVRCVRKQQKGRAIEFDLRSSWMKKVLFSGPAVANFRHSEISGGLTCSGVTQVVVDGCDISGALAIKQEPSDTFKKVNLTKCNLFEGATVLCARGAAPKIKKEKVRLQKFYFGPKKGKGLQKKQDIQKRVMDGSDLEDGNVSIIWTKPNKRPHLLVNYDLLLDRAPRLRR